ncbi:MAG: hypothetical protein AAB847_02960 [Patescibacteria group bacterium]
MKKGDSQIYFMQFDNLYKAAATFMRFQEYYESPRFKGKIFSWEEFMDYYAEKRGEFTYFEDFVGFNLPFETLTPFYNKKFDPLTEKERRFLELLKNKKKGSYIIGATRNCDIEDLRHEIVHGLFHTRPDYKRAVLNCLKKFNITAFKKALKKHEYHPSLYNDEINAYCLTGLGVIIEKSKVRKLMKMLGDIFYQFFGFHANRGNRRFWLKKVKILNL